MIAIIDYGVGNLGSVQKALEYIGYSGIITSKPEEVLSASGVILPGVGAFQPAIEALRSRGLDQTVKAYVASGRPFLGVCLGMQLLFDQSEEGKGDGIGLGILPGTVRRFPGNLGLKIPQIGWNDFYHVNDPMFRKGDSVYYVHSYFCDPADKNDVAATVFYGIEYACAIRHGNVTAMQFHPEKSGEVGLSILNRWARRTR